QDSCATVCGRSNAGSSPAARARAIPPPVPPRASRKSFRLRPDSSQPATTQNGASDLAKILVTGHLGYIGTHVVDLLVKGGHQTRGIDLDLYEGCNFDVMPRPHETRIKDVLDVTPEDLSSFDAVIHLAALSNDPLGELDP